MSVIYFDNAATSWPKPTVVREALDLYFGAGGGNPGRSGHRMSITAGQIVEDARDAVSELFNIPDPGQIAFTKNATEALNIAIYGLLQPGDHVITTSIEHNSVMRPLRHLESLGVELTAVPCAIDGSLNPKDVRGVFKSNTKLLVTLHGSNVMGTILPAAELAAIARDNEIPFLMDASQTAGAIPIDIQSLGLDLMAFTGHKGLLGLTGIGGLYIREGLKLEPLIRGGTGSASDLEYQPDFMPDVQESGTINVAGLAGLAASVRYLLEVDVKQVMAHEQVLVERLLKGIKKIPGLKLYGPTKFDQRCGVISFNIENLLPSDVGLLLDQTFGIMSRVGLHCAPGAHRTQETFPTGTVRFGFGYSNTIEEIDIALSALNEISIWALEQKAVSEMSYV